MKIGIIGTGVFSVSIALNLAANSDNEIIMWSENKELIKDYKNTHKLNNLFKGKLIPQNIRLTNNYDTALRNVDVAFLMTSVNYLESVCKDIKGKINKTIPVCIGTKGITENSNKLVHEVTRKYLKNPIFIISGPTFATDLANLNPFGIVVAGKNKKIRNKIVELFDLENTFVEETNDIKGIAICGCVKNIYAIGSGIINGLKYKESTRALYLKQAYKELETILYAYNSSLDTLHSLAGFGDFVLTCCSDKSRNYSYGEILGKNTSKSVKKNYLKENTVEGVSTLNALLPIFEKKHLKCPIINTIYGIIYNKEKADTLIKVITK